MSRNLLASIINWIFGFMHPTKPKIQSSIVIRDITREYLDIINQNCSYDDITPRYRVLMLRRDGDQSVATYKGIPYNIDSSGGTLSGAVNPEIWIILDKVSRSDMASGDLRIRVGSSTFIVERGSGFTPSQFYGIDERGNNRNPSNRLEKFASINGSHRISIFASSLSRSSRQGNTVRVVEPLLSFSGSFDSSGYIKDAIAKAIALRLARKLVLLSDAHQEDWSAYLDDAIAHFYPDS